MQKFIREASIFLARDKLSDYCLVSLSVSDPKAFVEKVVTVDKLDATRDVVFYIRDRGDPGLVEFTISVMFVLRSRPCTPLPLGAGRLLGCVSTSDGRWAWFVCAVSYQLVTSLAKDVSPLCESSTTPKTDESDATKESVAFFPQRQ